MKKITPKLLTITLILLFGGLQYDSMAEDISKVLVEKTFDINKDAKLVVRHEHGNVKCNNWDKNVISIKLTAKSNTSDQEKADKSFSRINWDVSGDKNEVFVESKISGKGNGTKHVNVSVELEIFMPKSVSLDFDHKFGNAFIEEVEGTALVTSGYGNVTIEALHDAESKLKVEFGSGKINNFGGGSMSVEYGKLTLGSAGQISVRSEYSDFSADNIETLDLKSEGGNVKIDKVAVIKGSSEFGNLEIDELANSLQVETGYGSLIVRHVNEDFNEISVVNEYGSAKLYIPDDATYHIDAETEFGSFKYPESMAEFSYKVKSHGESTYRGIIGKGSNPTSKVTIESSYGSSSLIAK